MIKEGINLIAEDIENITNITLNECNCSLEECFPTCSYKLVNIDGKEYVMSIEVKLKEYK